MVVIITANKKSQAQSVEKKEVKTAVTINNKDTAANGKKFTDVEKSRFSMKKASFNISKSIVIKKSDTSDPLIFITDSTWMRRFTFDSENGAPKVFEFKGDSLLRKQEGLKIDREMGMGRNFGDEIDWEMVHPKRPAPARPSLNGQNRITIVRPNQPNSYSFNYSTTDKDGFTTKIIYTVSEPSINDLKNTFKDEEININGLTITEVMLVPNFLSGKTILTFTAKIKGVITVNVLDSSANVIFSDSKKLAGENYSNIFSASKNGNYFLQITQGSQTYIRKVTLVRN